MRVPAIPLAFTVGNVFMCTPAVESQQREATKSKLVHKFLLDGYPFLSIGVLRSAITRLLAADGRKTTARALLLLRA